MGALPSYTSTTVNPYKPSFGPTQVLPPYPPSKTSISSVTPKSTLDSTASGSSASERQAQVIAENAPLRVVYGRDIMGAQVADILANNGYWIFYVIWGDGPFERLDALYMDDLALPSGVIVTSYNFFSVSAGTIGTGVDVTLAAAYAANSPSISFTDNPADIAYSVIRVPASIVTSGMPSFTAVIKGRRVYDPRDVTQTHGDTSTYKWSSCPSLCLADFIESSQHGLNKSLNWTSVALCASYNDTGAGAPYFGLVNSKPRRDVGITINTPKKARDWADTLSTYAGCWWVEYGGLVKLIPDRPAEVSETYDHSNGDILKLHSLKKRGLMEVPNVIEIKYTDTSVVPWRDRVATASLPGVLAGTSDRRLSTVSLPGIQDYSQALREATERLNKLNLGDLTCDIEVFDRGLKVEIGDVDAITYPIGLSAKSMRVTGVSGEYGRYRLAMSEYDPLMYSDLVATGPSTSDTNLPDPLNPPMPTSLTLVEDVFQLMDGTYSSRIYATWDAISWQYITSFRVEIWIGSNLVDAATVSENAYRSPPIQEGSNYTVKVATVSNGGAVSPLAISYLAAQGNNLPPQPVPTGSFKGFEAGGVVYLEWGKAIDIGVVRYKLKYGTTSQTYDQATSYNEVDTLRATVKEVPTGTWRFWVESVDSVRIESGTPRYADVTVTLDNNAFLISSYDQQSPTLTNMIEYAENRTDGVRHFVTDDGVSWNARFSSAMNTYVDPVFTYFATTSSQWQGEAEDFGQDLSGDWRGTATVAAFVGTFASELQMAMAATPSTWVGQGGLSAKASGRFCRLSHTAAIGSSMHVQIPTQNIRLDAIPREEVVNCVSSGSAAVTISWTNTFTKMKKVTPSVMSSTPCYASYDNVNLIAKTMDINVFDNTGARVASKPVTVVIQGV